MPKPHRPLPALGAHLSNTAVQSALYDFFSQVDVAVEVSDFTYFHTAPGKRSFLLSFESDRAAINFAQAYGLSVFGFSGVLISVD